ncbi:bifunctional 3'-5' exonuclease/DNA polymerase [Allonocardiopsis opalescens]|uniref:DNA-directed DNA polymerase n=1 Tax=Allonocardiopsis opalescens TaxID=1144618 RepID=A0A2T0PVB0_9ACTN|nr:bifunctional 3'-5' exonuclease/DNA polymerase [Allonocardiopsis opalescens]PRX95475.1 DNA polymerase-1 [Allonocardiopsis opalescens]
MRIAVVPTWDGGGVLRPLAPHGTPLGPPEPVADLAAAVAERERAGVDRWVWADADDVYPPLLAAGVRVERCHDVALVEALLLGHERRFGEPRSLGAAWARLHGRPVPKDVGLPATHGADEPATLFLPDRSTLPPGTDRLDALVEVHADQLRRIAAAGRPGRFALLCAVESAGALVAAEMTRTGLPWRPDVHDQVLTGLLGPRPSGGRRPDRLEELAGRISAALGRQVNPDSPAQLRAAFGAAGHPVESTRSWVLKQVDHPAVAPLLEYKELARVHAAHGWNWLDAWVRGGRFRPDYVVGGVVSGRWATRGGGALQIPRPLRRAVVADPGWRLVVADAGQLEPRVLAAVSGDRGLAEAARADDLYTVLGGAFGGDRQRAKIGLLAAMYGQTGGDAAQVLPVMRSRFPDAMAYVDSAARTGEDGGVVRSWLGRTSPPGDAWEPSGSDPAADDGARRQGRAARGRFTRNFVVQATAAEWALVLLAALRRGLSALPSDDGRPELVFYQHDEVIVHCPAVRAPDVVAALRAAEAEARRLLFGDTPVRFPLEAAVVDCYADAK